MTCAVPSCPTQSPREVCRYHAVRPCPDCGGRVAWREEVGWTARDGSAHSCESIAALRAEGSKVLPPPLPQMTQGWKAGGLPVSWQTVLKRRARKREWMRRKRAAG